MEFGCKYADCKRIAEWRTGFLNGDYCTKHFQRMKVKNPKLVGFKIEYSLAEREALKEYGRMKNFTLVKKIKPYKDLKGGQNGK